MVQEEKNISIQKLNRRLSTNPLGNPIHLFGFLFVQLGVFRFPREELPFFRGNSFPNGEALGVTELAQLVEAVQASPLLNLTEQDTKVRWFEGGWMGGIGGRWDLYVCIYICIDGRPGKKNIYRYTCMSKKSGVDWKHGTS